MFYLFIFFLLSPDDMPARMGLQESSEQIPGQCIQKGKGRMNRYSMFSHLLIDWLVGLFVVSKIPASLTGGTVNERVNAEI